MMGWRLRLHALAPSTSVRSPARAILIAAFTSRSWSAPQSLQTHRLIDKPAIPLGLVSLLKEPQHEQVCELYRSETSRHIPPRVIALYDSMVLKSDQPASSELFAKLVRAISFGLTSPMTISPNRDAISADALCKKSFRRLAIFA